MKSWAPIQNFFGKLLFAFVSALSVNAWAADGVISSGNCSYKIRDKKGKWKSYSGRLASGTKIQGSKSGSTAVFHVVGKAKEIFAGAISCVQFSDRKSKSSPQKSAPRESKTYLTVSGAPQYLTTSFKVDQFAVDGTLIGASLGFGVLRTVAKFQFRATLVLGFASGSASSSTAGYTVKYARGFYLMLPLDVYYSFGASSVGFSAGMQYISMDWPVAEGSTSVTTPDSRFSYIVDVGYRFMGDGFFIGPSVGLMGGGSLFAELRGGVAF